MFNLFSGIEGVTAAAFVSWISQYAASLPVLNETATAITFVPLEMPTSPAVALKAEAKIKQAICSVATVHQIDSMSKERIKALGVSPDAFFHAAVHLAYEQQFRRVPEVHNFIDLRMLKFGSISRYLSTTDEMRRFLRSRTRADLVAALGAHKRTRQTVRSGDYPLHYIYHYLFSSPSLHALAGLMLLQFFIPKFTARYMSPDLWLSNIPALPGLQFLCRFGLTLSFLRKHAYTGHYTLFADHIKICFLSRDENGIRAWNVKRELEKAFICFRVDPSRGRLIRSMYPLVHGANVLDRREAALT